VSTSKNWTCCYCQNVFSAPVEYKEANCPFCQRLSLLLAPNPISNVYDADNHDVEESGNYADSAGEPYIGQVGLQDISTTDIQQMMAMACEPITWRRRTFWEWLRDVDVVDQQLQRKAAASESARQMAHQRTALMADFRELMVGATQLAEVQFESRCRLLRMRVDALRLQSEQVRLGEEIREARALRPARLRTRLLEEDGNHQRLRVKLLPPPPPEDPDAEVHEAITTERKRLRARSTGRQMVIADFLVELQKVYRTRCSRTEKAMKIRAVMEAYGQEPDDLPRQIRKYLERVEASYE